MDKHSQTQRPAQKTAREELVGFFRSPLLVDRFEQLIDARVRQQLVNQRTETAASAPPPPPPTPEQLAAEAARQKRIAELTAEAASLGLELF